MTQTRAIGDGCGIALDDLIALNDEIAALSRAGLPLERGLLGAGGDLPGRLGSLARSLGSRMERGASLLEALEAEGPGIPPTYRAVVVAGLRSGRLAEALEGMSGFARSYVEMRRAIGLALLYPFILLWAGYGLFILFVVDLMPRLVDAFAAMRVSSSASMTLVVRLGNSVAIWGPILPLTLFLAMATWWRSGRASAFSTGQLARSWRWVPGVSSILDGATAAQFADWLALLIEHGVPWSEAVTIAAEASGDPRLKAATERIAESATRGQTPSQSVRGAQGLPPLLAWLMRQGGTHQATVAALRHAAETYRRRAFRRAATLRVALPSALLLLVGGTATFLYAMTLFAPWTALLRGMTRLG